MQSITMLYIGLPKITLIVLQRTRFHDDERDQQQPELTIKGPKLINYR